MLLDGHLAGCTVLCANLSYGWWQVRKVWCLPPLFPGLCHSKIIFRKRSLLAAYLSLSPSTWKLFLPADSTPTFVFCEQRKKTLTPLVWILLCSFLWAWEGASYTTGTHQYLPLFLPFLCVYFLFLCSSLLKSLHCFMLYRFYNHVFGVFLQMAYIWNLFPSFIFQVDHFLSHNLYCFAHFLCIWWGLLTFIFHVNDLIFWTLI